MAQLARLEKLAKFPIRLHATKTNANFLRRYVLMNSN